MKNIEGNQKQQVVKECKKSNRSLLYESLSFKYAKSGKKDNRIKFLIYMSERLMNSDIESLVLTVRSYNYLKRMRYVTIGDVVNNIEKEEDLLKIRNLGKTSAKEIMEKLLEYQYSLLSPDKRSRFLKRIDELNGD